ncbi:MAG: ammonium transporter [Gloeocapsa sp. DLM2.Bin57]|nr:MAG: ammonium transporter [Gloeocapsa sp. DLM2.Bin57]
MLNLLWLLLCSGLVFLMQAGFMCLESGLTRSKNSINVAVKNFADFILSAALFWLFGYGLMFGKSLGGWLGFTDFLFTPNAQPELAAFFLYQVMFCGTATTIISGAVAERLKFTSYLLIAGLVSGIIYPFFGHWVWNALVTENTGGWLQHLGFRDFAGSTVVHSVGAWVALAALLIIGPRQGRYTQAKIQGSNLPFSVLGVFLLWFGWIGFNGGSTFAFNATVPLIILNTMLAGVSGAIVATSLHLWRFKHLAVEALINGSLAGLVAITANCNIVTAPLAVIIGATGAAAMMLVEYWLDKYKIDDAVDAIAVHGGAGVWGTLGVALFGNLSLLETDLNRGQLLLVQMLGIGVAFFWSFGLSWLILRVVNSFYHLRVSPEAEQIGLNISEHQAKTETFDLLQVMEEQAKSSDLSLRVPVDTFTEVGYIASRYNQVIDSLAVKNQENVSYLEKIYTVTAIALASLENNHFDPNVFNEFINSDDELGSLAKVLQGLVQEVSDNKEELITLRYLLQNKIIDHLQQRFPDAASQIESKVSQIEDINILLELFTINSLSDWDLKTQKLT